MSNLTGGLADCYRCESEEKEHILAEQPWNWPELARRDFIVCDNCGGKRCNRAEDHRNACEMQKEMA